MRSTGGFLMSRRSRKTTWVIGAAAALIVLISSTPATWADSSPLVTTHPDLVAAQAISPKQVLACFDQILATPLGFTDTSFFLQGYAEGRKSGPGGELALSTETSTGGGFCVVAAFTGPGDASSYTRLVVLANAVTASVPGGGGAANVQDSVPLLAGASPTGTTSGPDLVSFQINRTSGLVSFVFDAPVSSAAGAIAPLSFHLIDRSGALTAPPNQGGTGVVSDPTGLLGTAPSGPQFSVSPANTVNVNFSAPTAGTLGLLSGPPDLTAVRSAVGVTVDEGAVTAAMTGVISPLVSFGITPSASSTGPAGPRTPPAPPFSALTALTTSSTTVPTARTCRRVVTLHLLRVVASDLRSATVTVNAKRAIVSKKLTVTISFAKYRGIRSIVVKIRGRRENRRSVRASKTYRNRC